MKNVFSCCTLLLLLCNVAAQSLIIKGKIRCMNKDANSTRGAENVIVVPAFMPAKSTITLSRPSGYFEFNTGVPIVNLQDKTVTIYAISRCASCKEIARRIFISEDQDRQNISDDKHYVTIRDWLLNTHCQDAEMAVLEADNLLTKVSRQPAVDLNSVSGATAITAAPATLNFLTTLITVAAAAPAGNYLLSQLLPGKIHYGQFLAASPLYQSANTGFNFSPSRDMSEAMFWNPSAIANSRKTNNISLLTNFKNNVKLGGFRHISKKISIGAGLLYTTQDEFRSSFFTNTDNPANKKRVDSLIMQLKEWAALVSGVYTINNRFSVALTVKSLWQKLNIPYRVIATDQSNIYDTGVTRQRFDVDLSATYKISTSFQAGINLMNLTGSKLFADAFVPGQGDNALRQQRALGIGLQYKWQRLNVGTDVVFNSTGFYDLAVGANYVPFNNALLSAGMTVKQLSYSAAFRIKYFRIGYINDNHWLINEKRKAKTAILDGRIYGGLVLDF